MRPILIPIIFALYLPVAALAEETTATSNFESVQNDKWSELTPGHYSKVRSIPGSDASISSRGSKYPVLRRKTTKSKRVATSTYGPQQRTSGEFASIGKNTTSVNKRGLNSKNFGTLDGTSRGRMRRY